MSSSNKNRADDVLIGGALNKDDLFEILQVQIDTLSTKSKSPDGISRDDLKPLIKAIQDLRGVGLGSDEAVKKGVDFQMKMTRQLVIQQDIKSAQASRNYEDMKAAAAKAKEINLKTRQAKSLESELLSINRELLKKANEENEKLRKLQQETTSGSSPRSSPPHGGGTTSASATSSAETGGGGSKRFFWKRTSEKRGRSDAPQPSSTPDDYQLQDDQSSTGGDSTAATPTSSTGDRRKSLVKQISSKLVGRRSTTSANNAAAAAPEKRPDDYTLADRPAVTFATDLTAGGVSEFQRQAQFDKLVEAMQRVKVVMDSPSEVRGPSPILAAAGPDMDLVTGDPNTVHLWLGEWHGVVKASSSSGNISSKTILVGEIDSKVSQGRWEIRMAKDNMPTFSLPAAAPSSSTSKEKEQEYLTELENLRVQMDGHKKRISQLEDELKTEKETHHAVRAAGPEVQALMLERSESIMHEAKEEEKAKEEEQRRLHSVTEEMSSPSEKTKQEYKFDDLDVDSMTMKELKQFITTNGGNVDGLREKDELVRKARELKGDSGLEDKKTTLGADSSAKKKPEEPVEEEEDNGGVKLKDDERFAKYFRMLKVGLDKDAVKHKMTQDSLDPSVLDADPNMSLASFERAKAKAAAALALGDNDNGVKLKDDERFAKYFKMLKIGLTKDAVKHKMEQDGFDPDILDLDPEGPASAVPPKELAPYLKMIQYGVPRAVVEYKMKSHNIDPALLDQYLQRDIARLDIKVGEDPRFLPFFKMLAVGVPKDAVRQKMISKGFDPDILDMSMDEMSPVDGTNINPNKKKQKRKKPDDGMQWKKLYWQPVTVPPPGPGVDRTVWTRDFGFELLDNEKQELRSLFAIKVGPAPGSDKSGASSDQPQEKEKSLQILEGARAQNVSILLSRFKISVSELKKMISTMRISDGSELTADDVKSILSMLPTSEESEKLRALPAEKQELLGQAEKHFLGLMEIPRYKNRIACFLFRLQFNELKEDVEFDIEAIQLAVNDLLDSQKLARLLSIILSIGNMLNSCGGLLTEEDGFKPASGFRLSSLSKLRLSKAHSSNKTALNFFVSILHERQRQVLDFILGETDHVRAAASVVMSNVKSQVKSLAMGVKELENEVNHAESVRSDPEASKKITREDEIFFDAVEAFFQKARRDVHDLSVAINKAEKDFATLVEYFKEESDTTPEALFKHLVQFFDDVSAALHENGVARAKAVRLAVAQEQKDAIADDSHNSDIL